MRSQPNDADCCQAHKPGLTAAPLEPEDDAFAFVLAAATGLVGGFLPLLSSSSELFPPHQPVRTPRGLMYDWCGSERSTRADCVSRAEARVAAVLATAISAPQRESGCADAMAAGHLLACSSPNQTPKHQPPTYTPQVGQMAASASSHDIGPSEPNVRTC